MKHPRAKGTRARRNCKEILEGLGWLVDVVEKTGRFVKVKDLFSLFDLIALKQANDDSTAVLLIQVTSNRPHNHHRLQAFKVRFSDILVEQWVRRDNRGWKVYKYGVDGKWRVL